MHGELPEGQPVSVLMATAKPQVLWESEPHILFPILPQWSWGSLEGDLAKTPARARAPAWNKSPPEAPGAPAGSNSAGHPPALPQDHAPHGWDCYAGLPAFLPDCIDCSQDRKVSEKPLR